MAVELSLCNITARIEAALLDTTQVVSTCSGQIESGTTRFPAISAELTNGTTSGKGNMIYADKHTIAAGASVDLDLSGSLTNISNSAATFTKVKQVVVIIDTPDGTKKVRVGPQNVSNAAQLWFGGTGATCYEEVAEWSIKTDRYTGWTITPGTGDILRIHNPTGVSVGVYIAITGVS